MRILLVIDSFFTGGAEFSTLELFSYLKDNGIEICICKTKDMHPQYDPIAFGLDASIINTLPKLGFVEKPNYDYLKELLKDLTRKKNIDLDT